MFGRHVDEKRVSPDGHRSVELMRHEAMDMIEGKGFWNQIRLGNVDDSVGWNQCGLGPWAFHYWAIWAKVIDRDGPV